MKRKLCVIASALMALAVGLVGAQDQPAGKIGVFDIDTLWKASDVGKKYDQDLTASHERLQSSIERKQQEVESLVEKLRQQQASLSDDKAQQLQSDIQNKRLELSRMSEDADREWKHQLGELQGRFQAMVLDTVGAFGKEKNFALILNKSTVDYYAMQLDITQALIEKLNDLRKIPATAAKTPDKKGPVKPKETPKPQ